MKKLFIIGNGFDMSHNIETSYENFKMFLLKKYPNAEDEYCYMPVTHFDRDGETIADEKSTCSLLIQLINETTGGKRWQNLETSVGQFDYEEFFSDITADEDDDDSGFHMAYQCEDMAGELKICVGAIVDLFKEWVDEIDLTAAKPKPFWNTVIERTEDLFLTFNYTNTLESVYKINPINVRHIHGQQGGELVFGHGEPINPYDETFPHLGAEFALSDLFELLRKKTDKCIQIHNDFFLRLMKEDIKDIYSFGFSFSEVDLNYIRKICRVIDTANITWHLQQDTHVSAYENEERKTKIRCCGFKGRFSIFHD